MALVESVNEDDEQATKEGINFIVSQRQNSYFQNTKLDFTKGIFGKGSFKLLKV